MEKKKSKTVTIHDVAKHAGTSVTTVSRVLNNKAYPVREELRQRVLDSVRELGYLPNQVARSLKNLETKEIGVIIPTVMNPFYASVVSGIEEEARKHSYNILLCCSSRDPVKEIDCLNLLYQKQVSGVIISSMFQNKDALEKYMEKNKNIVLLDQEVEDMDCSMINFNCQKGAYLAVDYLIQNGHREIAFISTPLTRWTRIEILKGYKEALKDNNITFDKQLVITVNNEKETAIEAFELEAGKKSARILLENRPNATAVFAINDMMAIGFIREITALGKNVPGDVSVVGFDDIYFASMITPALTTIQYPSYEVGMLAARLLLDKLNNIDTLPLHLNLEPKLIIRDSVKRLS